MYSDKENVLQTVALLKEFGVKHIVCSPGSRNAPLLQTFSQDPFFDCHVAVDERNAAFYAIGIIQALLQPVAVCCTSGTALLNYAPAVAEAFYQQLPLIVLSADRSAEWIGQMDGQTLPQESVFKGLVKKSVQLAEENEWYSNRLINEALIACTQNAWGPVHINIPISEPLFNFTIKELPIVRKINFAQVEKKIDIIPFAKVWNNHKRRMIVVGQNIKYYNLVTILKKISNKCDCVILAEHLSNCNSEDFISNFDSVIPTIENSDKNSFNPDLIISLGGHIVSKRIKQYLRENKAACHWHISESEEIADTFQCLTDHINMNEISFLENLEKNIISEKEKDYFNKWKKNSNELTKSIEDYSFSEYFAVGKFLKSIPNWSSLHLANSLAVRHAQHFSIDKSVKVFCNRGTNGIEGSLPSAIGYASVHSQPVYFITGDLSFFYTINALWNIEHIRNLRILLINNKGGGIFHQLPKLNTSESLSKYVAANHNTTAEKWVEAAGLEYLSAKNEREVKEKIYRMQQSESGKSILLEIIIDKLKTE